MEDRYELYYWPGIPGRGEYVRLVFEAAGVPYVDVAREEGGVSAIRALLDGPADPPAFAPPILKVGDRVLAQAPAICHFLAGRFGMLPDHERGQWAGLQHVLTVADFVSETHETHHPIDVSRYYDDQKAAARERAAAFREHRIPKFLAYFERALGDRAFLLGPCLSAADLGLFQTVEGLRYAFPRSAGRHLEDAPGVVALCERVRSDEKIAAYLASDRRMAFNEHGIFRHYAELDV